MGVTQYGEEHDLPSEHKVHRTGGWLPTDNRIHRAWLEDQIKDTEKNPKELVPVLKDFKSFIESDSRIFMYFNSMFDEVPRKHPYNQDPTGHKQVRDYNHMLEVLNHILTTAPHWTDAAANVGMVAVPICAVFDYPMSTASGYAAFLDPAVNAHLKQILNYWGKYLLSPESAEVLNSSKHGWFGPTAQKDIMTVANAPYKTDYRFEDFFVCDPTQEHHGYDCWDSFFTRRVQDEVRPISDPDNDNVVVNACESKTYVVAYDIKLRDHFWIKGQPYSVRDMLAGDPLADHFAGGTVYQAFLSALSYHRWHAPVSGTVRRAFVQDGTYFSEPLFETIASAELGPRKIHTDGLNVGQGYLSSVATRAIILIESQNPAIGLMAFIGIGMVEVSTCEITVKEGQYITKGQQMGMFHFGGSSHCLLFRKSVEFEGFPKPGLDHNQPVRGKLTEVKVQSIP